MARIERATSPLPRGCSTTEPHGHRYRLASSDNQASSDTTHRKTTLERETGIEPASSAWKAGVLPLNYSRPGAPAALASAHRPDQKSTLAEFVSPGGGGWIRTSVGVSQQIYSLPPLATRAPLRGEPGSIAAFIDGPAGGRAEDLSARRRSDRPSARANAAGNRPVAARDGGKPGHCQ